MIQYVWQLDYTKIGNLLDGAVKLKAIKSKMMYGFKKKKKQHVEIEQRS